MAEDLEEHQLCHLFQRFPHCLVYRLQVQWLRRPQMLLVYLVTLDKLTGRFLQRFPRRRFPTVGFQEQVQIIRKYMQKFLLLMVCINE